MFSTFTGTVAQVRTAFRAQIDQLSVGGRPHLANMSDWAIPAELSPIIKSIVSLNDFHSRPLYKPSYTTASGYYLVAPSDLAIIYNLKPLLASNTTGKGQTIVVLEDSTFRAPPTRFDKELFEEHTMSRCDLVCQK